MTKAQLQAQITMLEEKRRALNKDLIDQHDRATQLDTECSRLNQMLREKNDEIAHLRHELAMAHRETSKWKRAMAAVAEENPEPMTFGRAYDMTPPGWPVIKARVG